MLEVRANTCRGQGDVGAVLFMSPARSRRGSRQMALVFSFHITPLLQREDHKCNRANEGLLLFRALPANDGDGGSTP